jgi:hypothetical protein
MRHQCRFVCLETSPVKTYGNAQGLVVNLISQVIWVALVAVSSATLFYLFGTTDVRRLAQRDIAVPAWFLVLAALVGLAAGVLMLLVARRSSVVRGRIDATLGNVTLMRERKKVGINARIIRSTRFGRWPVDEVLESRADFRQELDQAILNEGADVRRIWNVSSMDDVQRLREMLTKYQGHANHSIRAYFDLPDHVLPELLIVESRGASISFPSARRPRDLDWMIRFKRDDLVFVVRDYFDVLWDRAERMLDAGDITADCERRLGEVAARLNGGSAPGS